MPRKFTKYPSDYVKASEDTDYPVVSLCFVDDSGRHTMVSGKLDDPTFIQDLVAAMKSDDDFAASMADMIDPDINNQVWEDTTYDNVAIDAIDWFKQDYDEWKSLKSRGREDSDFWVFISDDESIEVLS